MWTFLKKLKMEVPYNPAIPLLGLYPKKHETLIQKNICTSMFTVALLPIAKIWKHPEFPSIDKWIKKKQWNIYTVKYYLAKKKE